ncbi:MAG: glycosyltransferase, partial [Cyanobacteria bacterium J06607_17]
MEAQLKVSIVINNYNYERFLSEAIDSALEQTYQNVEVIVVDDGSMDGSRDIINRYGNAVIPIFQPNRKQGHAFNSGFTHSKGDIVIFLDADDYLKPEAAEKIVAAWKPQIAKVHYRLDVVDA